MAEEKKLQVFPVGITEKEIKKIADQAIADSGAANEVPLATIADAGKVIKVGDDGKYELAEAGGGSGGGSLYRHTINLQAAYTNQYGEEISLNFNFGVINSNENELTSETIKNYFFKNDYLFTISSLIDSGEATYLLDVRLYTNNAGYPGATTSLVLGVKEVKLGQTSINNYSVSGFILTETGCTEL